MHNLFYTLFRKIIFKNTSDELAQFSRIYKVDVRELLFVKFTEAGDEQRLTAKYSSFLKLLEKLSD